jgi:hypothetical protein
MEIEDVFSVTLMNRPQLEHLIEFEQIITLRMIDTPFEV